MIIARLRGYPSTCGYGKGVHWMDLIGSQITSRPRLYEPLFTDGWGDVDSVPTTPTVAKLPGVERRILQRSIDLEIDELRFDSPVASILPAPSAMVNAKVYRPAGAHRMAILFAAFNDHGYRTRDRLAAVLADRGVGATILESPYYGQRRTRSGQVMRTVGDFLRLGYGTVCEALAIARWYSGAGWTVGFAGYSMGGSVAGFAAACCRDDPVAVAPMAAAHSPAAVYVDAVLSQAVAWERLGPEGPERLRQTLDTISTLNLPPLPHSETAVLLAARGDGYVPLESTKTLADHWPGSEVRLAPGGHASLLHNRAAQVQAVVDAFDRFESWGVRSGLRSFPLGDEV